MIVIEAGFAGVAYPLDHPRVCGQPISGTVSASTAAAGHAAAEAVVPETWTSWRPTAVPADWTLTFAASAPVSYVGIAAHSAGTAGATIAVQRWTGSAWETVVSHAPTDDMPILFLMRRRTLDRIRVAVTGAVCDLGVIYAGDACEFPVKARYTGQSSFADAIRDEFAIQESDGGHWLNRYRLRRSQPVQMAISHLSRDWKAAYLDGLLADLRVRPAFVADRPGVYPASVAYAWMQGAIVPERQIANAAVAYGVTFDLIGHVPGAGNVGA